ncbi:hypothetical protein [Campylobacter devanensis]|uniref:hypothetical protein n=1 Tax=Campylobacter devanensis TaxID=3161138 RepID=UPI000A344B3C|nr:hypothetical protein [Campylobacter sp. P155]
METLNKFKERFVESGRLFSELTSKKQRVSGKRGGYFYVALYDIIQDKWALVANHKAGYPCYSLDDKGTPIVIYLDKMGNIRQRVIKQEMFNEILETSEGSQEFRDNLRASQKILKSKYNLEFIKPSLGYNLDDLPYSCQKGKGRFFKWCDDIAEMALLKNNEGKIVARCLIWDKENIKHNGEPCLNNLADRLYGNESIHRIALKNELKKLGIESIWERDGEDDRPFKYREFTLHLPEDIKEALDITIEDRKAPFLDTFNHYNENEGILYSFHWSDRLGYEYCEWDDDTTKVLLDTSGYTMTGDDEVWDDYNECYISRDNAVEPINYDGTTHMDYCIYSEYHNGYLLDDGDLIAVNTVDECYNYDYTYVGSGVELVEIDDKVYFLGSVRRYRA